jgi:hypothetical protein
MYNERIEERTARRNTDIGNVIVASFEGARKTATGLPEIVNCLQEGQQRVFQDVAIVSPKTDCLSWAKTQRRQACPLDAGVC